MTKPTMALAELAENGADADLLREMIQVPGACFLHHNLADSPRVRAEPLEQANFLGSPAP